MSLPEYYRENVTYISRTDVRLATIVDLVAGLAPSATLDLACGRGYLLDLLADRGLTGLAGVDVFDDVGSPRWAYAVADVTGPLPFATGHFDCVVAGEIIEHVPHPDALLREIRRVLRPGGHLVLSTPNLVSWANRILVPFGVQPLATETSSEIALGRFLPVLGQGNQVQGHLKVFTWRALTEIHARYGFRVRRRIGVPAFFPWPVSLVDRFFARIVPLASGLIYVSTAPTGGWPTPPAGRRREG
ncbi:MAG TPA: class I SAM-dependent methyltransferase [Kineosporiaceae bacterium]